MAKEVYDLGDKTATIENSNDILFKANGVFGVLTAYNVQPHELRKLAQAIEDNNRMRELGEDSNHVA
jgi:hypothetical protein